MSQCLVGKHPNEWRPLRTRLCAAVVVAGLILTVAGCSVPGRTTQATGGGLSAHVLRTSAFPQNHIPPFDQTVTDSAKAEALYAALQAPPPPKDAGAIWRPNDMGVAYHLTFSHGQAPTSRAIVQAGGCEEVHLSNGEVRWALGQEHFWTVFASALGVSRSDLFPQGTSSGPSAPQTDPSQL